MDVWSPCETSPPSTTPCAGLAVVGIWSSTSIPVVGDVYEYPANSGNFYEIIFDHDGNISSPTGNGNEEFWLPIDCPCDETWIANGQPVWDSTILNYSGNYVVEWPAGSGIMYISESGGITGAGEPGIDTHWIPCDGNPPLNGAPCNGSESSGVWNSTTVVEIEEVYEYPANSGSYYEVIQHDPNGLITTAPGEDQDYEFWSPISCTCEEKWIANGEPVWDATVDYPGNYVVAWPYGSNNLYVPLEPTGVMNGAEPGIDPHWIHCVDENPPAVVGPCDGSESSGVWNSTTVVEIEEVYEYPANSGSYYEVIQHDPNGLITTAPGEDQDYEFWSPISCTCEEKWIANGEPVWDATVDYPGNYVVAWPYGSNNLYVPLEPTGVMNGAEPGIDPHWIHCVDEDVTVESDEPEDGGLFGLPSIGVLGTIIAITMSVFVFGRDQRIH